jgi:predicted CoA-substrate-specific enzyme activase
MPMNPVAVGIDMGAETAKVVTLGRRGDTLVLAGSRSMAHGKDPQAALAALLGGLDLGASPAVAATGRLGRVLGVNQVPTKAALRRGVRLVHPELESVTVISIGAHGFGVLELHSGGREHWQQNSRCSQGTGNFLAQLVARFGLTVEEASRLSEAVERPAALSGRCPVILKTDMTHLANKGEDRAAILAGLYDAVCENVVTLIRPGLGPRDVVLVGGVTRSPRIRRRIGEWLGERGLTLADSKPEDELIEAIGAAACAIDLGAEAHADLRRLDTLLAASGRTTLERIPPLSAALEQVRRLARPRGCAPETTAPLLLGLDIGSTGSKAAAIVLESGQEIWEAYLETEGAPVRAAQRLFGQFASDLGETAPVVGIGVTGSGREVVGSLLKTTYGAERVFVLNEIAAHARAAVSFDPEVDTIFEIGGQDAKYIRLDGGRVVDAAMNEACSAGTGSFIAEQGLKLDGAGRDVRALGRIAAGAAYGVSLGQHCSVFMAEVIDEAISQNVERSAIVAGLYDSVIQNYLNRVKGQRGIGRKIFCQGMPFSADALAAAVARQTGREVVVPPNPGTMGALGIALLLRDERRDELGNESPLVCRRFLDARVKAKETFVCRSAKGCGGGGNRCRIDRLVTDVDGREERFLWGGSCSLHDRGAARRKLPEGAPDPFQERETLIDTLLGACSARQGRPVVALTDEFALKGLLPWFVTFLGELGFDCRVLRHAGADALRRGIESARIPYCAPLQMYHGIAFELVGEAADAILLPMLKSLPRQAGEDMSELCPMVLGSPDLVGGVLPSGGPRVLTPVVEFDGEGFRGGSFRERMLAWAAELGSAARADRALDAAAQAQERFESDCSAIGQRALEYCAHHGIVPVAVLGRPYTIYNDVLNSNVPSLLRSLGAVAIPVDCVPVDPEVPTYSRQYWGYSQRILRAATYVRRKPGLYSVFCSNYACGPDSFTLQFYTYLMQNKPSAVVETDGHSGDAGTKTRMEAFLYCVDTDLKSRASELGPRTDFVSLDVGGTSWRESRKLAARVVMPRMGQASVVASAALRAEGFRAETLPLSTREDVRRGRQHTSGKECVPMMLTLGTLLNYLDREVGEGERVGFFMPTTRGPCRFGVYNVLHRLVLDQLGFGERVSTISPDETDYFREMSADFTARLWVGFVAHDLLQAMLFDVRPVEVEPGLANAIFARHFPELIALMERAKPGTAFGAAKELVGGMWGTRALLARAAREFAQAKHPRRRVSRVALVGEIYVRLDPFANDFLVDKLEARGLGVRFAPFVEWLEYTAHLGRQRVRCGRMIPGDHPVSSTLTDLVQRVTLDVLYGICQRALGWPRRLSVVEAIRASQPYIHRELHGEATLTLGGPLHEYQQGLVDGVVIVGPHECMPCKLAEAQFGKVVEEHDLPYLSLAVNGDPIDPEVLDRFAYDIRERARGRGAERRASSLGLGRAARAEVGWRELGPTTVFGPAAAADAE